MKSPEPESPRIRLHQRRSPVLDHIYHAVVLLLRFLPAVTIDSNQNAIFATRAVSEGMHLTSHLLRPALAGVWEQEESGRGFWGWVAALRREREPLD
jgi:hypothetical protein